MKFSFLGTGTSQGVPVIGCPCEVCQSTDPRDNRLRTSGLLQSENTTIVFDTGPDFRQQMLRQEVKILDAVVFTHQHKDHVAGLDDVRAYNFLLRRDMPIYANSETIAQLKKEFYYAFNGDDYPGVPRLQIMEIDRQSFTIGDITLRPIPVIHGKMGVLGFRCGPFAYITDANEIPAESMRLLQGVEYLVLNALRKKRHHSHFTLDEAVAMSRIIGARQTWFTHISHLMGRHKEIDPLLPPGIHLAFDGLEVEW